MTTDVIPSEYTIMDEADSKQIQNAESAVKQALAYESRGKKQLSYMGIKWIVLKMSQKDQALEVIDLPCIELMKHDPDNQQTWIWYCTIKARNTKTGLVTVGASESPFLEQGKYDSFGRTKAISKAERNAYRKQIPEIEINAMLETLDPNDVQKLNSQKEETTPQHTTPEPVATHYLQTLKDLGYTGIPPKTSFEASNLITKLKSESKSSDDGKTPGDAKKEDYKKYCICEKFVENSLTGGKTCQNCMKLKPEENN